MKTIITPNKNLFNSGQCFTKDKEYTVNKLITTKAALIDIAVTNDLNEYHIIGSWWRNFKIKTHKS